MSSSKGLASFTNQTGGQADANKGHAFGILMACVAALRTFGDPTPLTLGVSLTLRSKSEPKNVKGQA